MSYDVSTTELAIYSVVTVLSILCSLAGCPLYSHVWDIGDQDYQEYVKLYAAVGAQAAARESLPQQQHGAEHEEPLINREGSKEEPALENDD